MSIGIGSAGISSPKLLTILFEKISLTLKWWSLTASSIVFTIEQQQSALLKTSDENVLIDTSPDLRQQLLRHKISKIDKVFYSHIHSDQTHGINDLRIFYIKNRKPINVYADLDTSKYLKKSFSYCFNSYSKEYPATLKLNRLKNNHLILNRKSKRSFISHLKDLPVYIPYLFG